MEWIPSWQTIISYAVSHGIVAFAFGGAVGVLGARMLGRGYKRRIAEMEEREMRHDQAAPSIVLHEGATYSAVEGDRNIHYYLNGSAEIVQPKPEIGEPVPLEIRADFRTGPLIAEAEDS